MFVRDLPEHLFKVFFRLHKNKPIIGCMAADIPGKRFCGGTARYAGGILRHSWSECRLPGLSATRRLAHKFPHGGERLVAHTVQRRPGVAKRPSYLGYVGYKRGDPTRKLMSCNSNSQREIEVVGRVDLKHPPLG